MFFIQLLIAAAIVTATQQHEKRHYLRTRDTPVSPPKNIKHDTHHYLRGFAEITHHTELPPPLQKKQQFNLRRELLSNDTTTTNPTLHQTFNMTEPVTTLPTPPLTVVPTINPSFFTIKRGGNDNAIFLGVFFVCLFIGVVMTICGCCRIRR
jgi:hypothetical protein